MSKPVALTLGTLLVVVGGVFTLQGLGYLAGSAMTGVTLWAIVGPIIVVVGLILIVTALRARKQS